MMTVTTIEDCLIKIMSFCSSASLQMCAEVSVAWHRVAMRHARTILPLPVIVPGDQRWCMVCHSSTLQPAGTQTSMAWCTQCAALRPAACPEIQPWRGCVASKLFNVSSTNTTTPTTIESYHHLLSYRFGCLSPEHASGGVGGSLVLVCPQCKGAVLPQPCSCGVNGCWTSWCGLRVSHQGNKHGDWRCPSCWQQTKDQHHDARCDTWFSCDATWGVGTQKPNFISSTISAKPSLGWKWWWK